VAAPQNATTRMSNASVTAAGQAQDSSQGREQKAFRDQLANDAKAVGAERRSDRQFMRARGCSHEEQVGDVGTTDEQHDAADDSDEQRRSQAELPADQRIVK